MDFEEFITKIRNAEPPEVIDINDRQLVVLPNYDVIKDDLEDMDNPQLYRYQLARNAGFEHNMALEYALKGYKFIRKLFD